MSADRGNKNFTMWHYLFSYARYSNKDQRLSLLGALILPLEAIPQAVGAIPLRLGVFLGVLGCQGLFPWHLELLPWCWGLTPWVLGATSRALGAIPRALEANPRIQNFEQSSPRKMPQKKNYLQHLQQGKWKMTQKITTCSIYNRANDELKYYLLGARRLKPIRAQKEIKTTLKNKGSFTNYVYIFLPFFDPPTHSG